MGVIYVVSFPSVFMGQISNALLEIPSYEALKLGTISQVDLLGALTQHIQPLLLAFTFTLAVCRRLTANFPALPQRILQ